MNNYENGKNIIEGSAEINKKIIIHKVFCENIVILKKIEEFYFFQINVEKIYNVRGRNFSFFIDFEF
jgi:hypothetical protein